MTQMTHLSHTLEKTVYAAKYDAAAKRLVADKQVLARIIKGTVKEFADYSIEEIIAGIEEEPEIATHEVYPGAIHGMNTESAIPGEGKVTYDVYFYVMTRERVPVKFLIKNVLCVRMKYMAIFKEKKGMCNLGEGLWDKAEARGMEIGMEKGIVETCQELGKNHEETIAKLMYKFKISREEAEKTVAQYWITEEQ